jgi:hypothetical protein
VAAFAALGFRTLAFRARYRLTRASTAQAT